jgi:hypothetical protein
MGDGLIHSARNGCRAEGPGERAQGVGVQTNPFAGLVLTARYDQRLRGKFCTPIDLNDLERAEREGIIETNVSVTRCRHAVSHVEPNARRNSHGGT